MQVSEESEELDQRTFSVVGSTDDRVYRLIKYMVRCFANGKIAVFNIISLVNSNSICLFYTAIVRHVSARLNMLSSHGLEMS